MNIRRKLGVLVVAAVALLVAQPAHAVSASPIRNWGSWLCLDVDHFDDFYRNGARIQQWSCTGQTRQSWTFSPAFSSGGYIYYQISNRANGKCLDVTDGRNADWTPVQQWSCDIQAKSQRWRFDDQVPTRFVSYIGGRCLDVAWGSLDEGAALQTYHCTSNNAAQIFVRY